MALCPLLPRRHGGVIFKIVQADEWHAVGADGFYRGSAKDKADTFLHFSTEEQLVGTLTRYYADAGDLVLPGIPRRDAHRGRPVRLGALPHASEPCSSEWSRPGHSWDAIDAWTTEESHGPSLREEKA